MNRTFTTTMLAAGLLAWLVSAGWAQILSIPNYLGRPGTEVVVPLEIDDAAGLASVRATVNFDRNVLELVAVQRGPLGSLFDLVWQHDDGVLDVFLARDEALVSGSGRLVFLTFRINAGAETNLYSDLALADFELGDESGVVAVERTESVSGTGGRLTVTDSRTIDNAGNGLPDEWELASGLDPFSATADGDADGDGLTNGQEAQLGFDPTKADTDGDGYDDRSEHIAGTGGTDGDDFLMLSAVPGSAGPAGHVFRWDSATGRLYSVLYSTNLLGAWPVAPLHVVHGDGTEKSFTNENAADFKGYFRLKVDLE
jgi:hypothetical protein